MKQLRMIMRSLANLQPTEIPESYTFRVATEADRPTLLETLQGAFPEFEWDESKLDQQLFAHPQVFATYIIEHAGKTVATASGVIRPSIPDQGYVHWVGVHPNATGKKLGLQVTLALLHEFRARELKSAILDTDEFRLPALSIYFRMGFEPQSIEDGMEERWRTVIEELQLKQEKR